VLCIKRPESETSFTVIFSALGQTDFRTKGRGGFPAYPFAVREVTPYFGSPSPGGTPFLHSAKQAKKNLQSMAEKTVLDASC
jgi:hypothetical protein